MNLLALTFDPKAHTSYTSVVDSAGYFDSRMTAPRSNRCGDIATSANISARCPGSWHRPAGDSRRAATGKAAGV